MVRKVGADDFLAKFHPDELARRVNDRVLAITGENILPQE
jgi:two-component system, chemotaxis family, chemotaxis protein CheV